MNQWILVEVGGVARAVPSYGQVVSAGGYNCRARTEHFPVNCLMYVKLAKLVQPSGKCGGKLGRDVLDDANGRESVRELSQDVL